MKMYTCNMVAFFEFLNKLYYKTFQININITQQTQADPESVPVNELLCHWSGHSEQKLWDLRSH